MSNKYLDSYPLNKEKEIMVYWVPGDPATRTAGKLHRPVEMQIRRLSDGAILHILRKSYAEARDILEVDIILKNAERCGKIPSAIRTADKKGA